MSNLTTKDQSTPPSSDIKIVKLSGSSLLVNFSSQTLVGSVVPLWVRDKLLFLFLFFDFTIKGFGTQTEESFGEFE